MKKYAKILLCSILVLSIFGIIMIYSSSNVWATYRYNNPYKFLISQSVFFIIGLIIITILKKIDYKIYYD